ncbi:IscS subfamily cysteine desulfurase [Psychrobacillus soli]|uniref:Aminotransferase class V-fold PLP-dependent enzyme n=1 Tax=Psychrobacillus soli TaxID=1543965 RepID=A0A544TK10_9BACI|nr:IscS subfamily cysteine desulfurase [Psychrobacillus soli]TQR17759.1 aminotransferase class V-fold PLP-dependent enzyme [Psychrobacillus soli]
MHYFDYAATTPLHPEAAHVYGKISQECFGNTSSLHEIGGVAQNMLAFCREELANMLGVESAGVYFTSGGTESNLLSIISLAKANKHRGKHIITTLGEHPSVDSALDYLKEDGFTVTAIPFTKEGFVDLQLLEEALTSNTILVSVQHINPEIGTMQPLDKIAAILKERSILFHSDCVQSFGKIDLKKVAKIVDSFTVSSHKVYGPKGVGVAYIHPRHRLVPVFPGLVHESGFRGGTVNVPGIAAFVTAAKQTEETLTHQETYRAFRNAFLKKIMKHSELFTVYQSNDIDQQLPQIIGLGIKNVEGQLVMLELNRHGFAISTGSACKVGQQHASKVLIALQVDLQKAKEFIRISFGSGTTLESIDALTDKLVQIAQKIHAPMMKK